MCVWYSEVCRRGACVVREVGTAASPEMHGECSKVVTLRSTRVSLEVQRVVTGSAPEVQRVCTL